MRRNVAPPRVAGRIPVGQKRHLEFAEFGVPGGLPLLWFHGTPGSCRQVAPAAKAAAEDQGIRIICVARPGAGTSTLHRYGAVVDFASDIREVVASLGVTSFAVVGLSGSGPYTLAAAAALPENVRGVGVLGGVAPTVGVDAIDGGVAGLAERFQWFLRFGAAPMGGVLNAVFRPLIPFGDQLYAAVSSLLPEGDQAVFAQPGVKDMFLDDLMRSILKGGGLHAPLQDARLFGRDWGFRLADVRVPVHWWHGDSDTIVPLTHGAHVISRLPDAHFQVRPGDSHLSGYAAAAEVITTMRSLFE